MFETEIPRFANTRPERSQHQYLNKNLALILCTEALKCPTLSSKRWQCSAYTLVSFRAVLNKGKKENTNKNRKRRRRNSVKTKAICRMVKSQGTTFVDIRSNRDGRDKRTTITKICDGHLTLRLIFTSSDGWNAIWGEEEKKKKGREKPSPGSCNRKLLLATICSSTRFFSSLCQPSEPPLENRAGPPNE